MGGSTRLIDSYSSRTIIRCRWLRPRGRCASSRCRQIDVAWAISNRRGRYVVCARVSSATAWAVARRRTVHDEAKIRNSVGVRGNSEPIIGRLRHYSPFKPTRKTQFSDVRCLVVGVHTRLGGHHVLHQIERCTRALTFASQGCRTPFVIIPTRSRSTRG